MNESNFLDVDGVLNCVSSRVTKTKFYDVNGGVTDADVALVMGLLNGENANEQII